MIKPNISVSARDGYLPDSVVKTIQSKAEKLPRFFERLTRVDVVVRLKNPEQPSVECKVSAEEVSDFFATDSGHNVITAFDKVLRKIEHQLKKHKEKLTDHRVARNQHPADGDSED